MKTLYALLILAAVFLAGYANAQTAFQAPLVSQVHGETWNCTNNQSASIDVQTQNVDGTWNGVAYYSNFTCKLRVHSGRGPGIAILSGCANVAWDQYGTLLHVTPLAWGAGTVGGRKVPCTP